MDWIANIEEKKMQEAEAEMQKSERERASIGRSWAAVRSLIAGIVSLWIPVSAFALFFMLTGVAVAVQHEVPYFVDVAGNEVDLERETQTAAALRRLPEKKRFQSALSDTGRFTRWRIYLRSDGTWTYDPLGINGEQYSDHFYPVEYVLPFGYRGAFQVAWGVQGAPPLQIVNDKIEVYVPATGVVETSSQHFLDNGTVALNRDFFSFDHEGERTAIAVNANGSRDQFGIIRGPTSCPGISVRCESFFVGLGADWLAITSTKCQTGDDIVRVVKSGHNCEEVPPGSTQPVSDIVPRQGKPAIRADEFHGRTLNGRRVVLSGKSTGVNSWRYEGAESNADDSTLTLELRRYIEATLTANASTQLEKPACSQDQMRSLLRLSMAGPYRFTRAPFSNAIKAEFMAGGESSCTTCPGIAFFRRDEGWKLAGCSDDVTAEWYSITSVRFAGMAALGNPSSVQVKGRFPFIGTPSFQNSAPVFLHEDGTWNFAARNGQNLSQGAYTGHDMNGNQLVFEINDRGHTWRMINGRTLRVHEDAVSAGLNQALDRFIELLSSGSVEEFLAHGGGDSDTNFRFMLVKLCEEPTGIADTDEFCENFRQDGKTNFKTLLQQVLQHVNIAAAVQELKQLRNEAPRISPIVFSPDFEALYTLPPKTPGGPQTIRRLVGHGVSWNFDTEM
jgi:hypothetical protein